jgi:hypothetical protein
VLRGGRLVPAAWDGRGRGPSAGETREVARKWWETEVRDAKEFLGEITEVEDAGRDVRSCVLGNALKRPLLREVLAELMRSEGAEAPLILSG